jgi:hypothetical protein
MALIHDAEDSRHTYQWSPHGILVRQRKGEWAAYYSLRENPTTLVLIAFSFGEPPGELKVDFCTLGDIERNILRDPYDLDN